MEDIEDFEDDGAISSAPEIQTGNIEKDTDLPKWESLFNAAGGPLAKLLSLKEGVLIGPRLKGDVPREVYAVTTREKDATAEYSGIIVRLLREPNTVLRGRFTASQHVLDIVQSTWAGQTTVEVGEGDDTIHRQWDEVLNRAHKMRASDIHLRIDRGRATIRLRINGDLGPPINTLTYDEGISWARAMYNTMKDKGTTRGGLDLRISQSTSVTRDLESGRVRLRFQSNPIADGFYVTNRLIDMDSASTYVPATKLGYSQDQEEDIDRIFARSAGLIVFMGPTGSGKSTSMANFAVRLTEQKPYKLLRTIEEPVEKRIPLAAQMSLARPDEDGSGGDKKNNVFALALSAMMRADPDYMMVGEIRDYETASLAIEGVRTGHLLITTLHADGAPMAYERFRGLGVPGIDLASVGLVAGLIYQRLMPVLCAHCKIPARDVLKKPEYAGVIGRLHNYVRGKRPDLDDSLDPIFFRNPAGCDHCNFTGVSGRTIVAEIMQPKPLWLPAIRDGDSLGLWKLWRETIQFNQPEVMRGRTAFEHARWKAFQGNVSPIDVEELQPIDEEPLE